MQGEAGDRARGRAVGRSDMRKGKLSARMTSKRHIPDKQQSRARSGCREIPRKTNDTHWQTNVKQLLVKHVWMQHTGVFSVSLL